MDYDTATTNLKKKMRGSGFRVETDQSRDPSDYPTGITVLVHEAFDEAWMNDGYPFDWDGDEEGRLYSFGVYFSGEFAGEVLFKEDNEFEEPYWVCRDYPEWRSRHPEQLALLLAAHCPSFTE